MMETVKRISQIYPLTDMLTGKTTYAVYTGEYDKRNPQRLIGGPELRNVFSSREEALQFAAAPPHVTGGEMTYDAKCLELAEHFLGDCSIPDDRRARLEEQLAGVIQHAIEDFIQGAVPETDRP